MLERIISLVYAYSPSLDLISDYLYRVLASNDAGTGLSPWVYGKTKEGGTQTYVKHVKLKHMSLKNLLLVLHN